MKYNVFSQGFIYAYYTNCLELGQKIQWARHRFGVGLYIKKAFPLTLYILVPVLTHVLFFNWLCSRMTPDSICRETCTPMAVEKNSLLLVCTFPRYYLIQLLSYQFVFLSDMIAVESVNLPHVLNMTNNSIRGLQLTPLTR